MSTTRTKQTKAMKQTKAISTSQSVKVGKRVGIDWGKADWSRQDVELSLEYGCTREAVRQARIRCGGGASASHRRRTLTVESRLSRLGSLETDGMTLPELARVAGCKERRVAVVLQGMGRGYRRRPRGNAVYDWTKFPVNWAELTDKELAVIVGADNPAVVTQWRNRHGYSKKQSVESEQSEKSDERLVEQ